MNFEKAVTKVEKLTGQKASIADGRATTFYKGYRIEFFLNGKGPEATCYSTCRQDLHMDTQTDYFPQTFHDNITQCVKHIDRMVPEAPADETKPAEIGAHRTLAAVMLSENITTEVVIPAGYAVVETGRVLKGDLIYNAGEERFDTVESTTKHGDIRYCAACFLNEVKNQPKGR